MALSPCGIRSIFAGVPRGTISDSDECLRRDPSFGSRVAQHLDVTTFLFSNSCFSLVGH